MGFSLRSPMADQFPPQACLAALQMEEIHLCCVWMLSMWKQSLPRRTGWAHRACSPRRAGRLLLYSSMLSHGTEVLILLRSSHSTWALRSAALFTTHARTLGRDQRPTRLLRMKQYSAWFLETPTTTTSPKSAAIHLQFALQYTSHL